MKTEGAQHLLSRLNPKSSSWDERVDGLHGGITASDVAMAMAGAEYIDECIARMVYAGQLEHRDFIRMWLFSVVISLSDGWDKCTSDQKANLAQIVLDDVAPIKRCGVCNGRGKAPDLAGEPENCPKCDGYGVIKRKSQDKWGLLGVNRNLWYRVWQDRGSEVQIIYQEHETIVLNKLVAHFA